MTEYRDWSITASANTGNAVDGYFKENMAYSDVNDAAREFQAILARDRLDKNGTLVSTGATSSYIVTINATLSAYQDGDIVAFQAHAKNDGASTLTIRHPSGSLSARPVVKTDLSPLEAGDIVAGGTYVAFYKSASANFQVLSQLSPPRHINGDLSVSGGVSLSGGLDVGGDTSISGTLSVAGFSQPTVEAKYKTADESVTSSATFQDDNHLTNFTVVANGVYTVEGLLHFDAAADAPGFKVQFVMSQNYGDESPILGVCSDTSGVGAKDVGVGITSSTTITLSDFTTQDDTGNPCLQISGVIYGNASSAGTFKLQWAQAGASATAMTLKGGSWLRLTRLA